MQIALGETSSTVVHVGVYTYNEGFVSSTIVVHVSETAAGVTQFSYCQSGQKGMIKNKLY